jgi:hypothetical protein
MALPLPALYVQAFAAIYPDGTIFLQQQLYKNTSEIK